MLFNIIRDFFVQHVWGGTTSNGVSVSTRLGFFNAGGQFTYGNMTNSFVKLDNFFMQGYTGDIYLSFGDWLSTTSTIITFVFILICIAFFIRWLFKVVSNSILLR